VSQELFDDSRISHLGFNVRDTQATLRSDEDRRRRVRRKKINLTFDMPREGS
jgi:hypothetical protein